MRAHLAFALLLLSLALPAASAAPATQALRPSQATLRCKPGFKHAVIAGKERCLHLHQKCLKRYDRQYHRYGFHCHNGRLTARRKPKPPPPPPPPPPSPPSADLSVTVSDAPDPVAVGDDLRYTAAVGSDGPESAIGVRVTIALSSGTAFFAAATQGTCTGTTTIVCELGSVAPGATPSATIALRPTAAGNITGTATVSATTADPNTANNTASATTSVTAPPPPPPPRAP
jgi:uncharacterized repeat protein (TIGR01451 family)